MSRFRRPAWVAAAALCVAQLKREAKDCPTADVTQWQVPPRCTDACTYAVWDTDR